MATYIKFNDKEIIYPDIIGCPSQNNENKLISSTLGTTEIAHILLGLMNMR